MITPLTEVERTEILSKIAKGRTSVPAEWFLRLNERVVSDAGRNSVPADEASSEGSGGSQDSE